MPLPLRLTLASELPAPPKLKLSFNQNPKLRAESIGSSFTSASSPNPTLLSPSVSRRILKPPKRPSDASSPGHVVSGGLPERIVQAGQDIDERQREVAAKPKLTLKLSLKGAGAGRAKP